MTEPPEDTPTPAVGRCPSCGARVTPGQDWCTLCLQPLTAPRPDLTVDDPHAGLQPPGAPAPQGELPPGAAEAMLAELAAATSAERPLSSGPLAGASRGMRTALGCGAALVLALVLVGLFALVGLVL